MDDPWRFDEWDALPEGCGIAGCETPDHDPRGPLFMTDGTFHRLCPEHWEAVFRVLGHD